MSHLRDLTKKEQIRTAVFLILTLICGIGIVLNPLTDLDVYNRKIIAFRLILSAVLNVLFGIFITFTFYYLFRGIRSRKLRLAVVAFILVVTETLYFSQYITPLQPVYTSSDPHPNPVLDIQKAFEILNEDEEPVEVFGFFSCIPYHTFLTNMKSNTLKETRYTLRSEDGTEIISSGESTGIYTVTYAPKTHLPYEIIPYDPECGENELTWEYFSDQAEEWASEFPDLPYVRSVKLTRTFPRMLLRITKDNSIIKEQYYEKDCTDISLALGSLESGIYTAQLFAVFNDSAAFGIERFCPISNTAAFRID